MLENDCRLIRCQNAFLSSYLHENVGDVSKGNIFTEETRLQIEKGDISSEESLFGMAHKATWRSLCNKVC